MPNLNFGITGEQVMKKWFLKSEQGFTLVELMVVVAIIGILSAIAVPNFKKYQAKSKQSEAKIQLAAVYTTEIGANSDYDTYATCLTDLGYEVPPKGYYWVGFAGSEATTLGNVNARTNPTVTCTAVSGATPSGFSYAIAPTNLLKANNASTTAAAGDLQAVGSGTNPTTTSFTASTAGNISGTSAIVLDKWTITQTKALTNSAQGF